MHATIAEEEGQDLDEGENIFVQNGGTRGGVNRSYVLLNNQSTVNQIANPSLLANIRKSKNPITVHCNNGSNAGSQGRQFKKSRNMGAYCSSHGFHPVGNNHDSVTCIYKKPEHKIEATWCNRLGGDMYWPNANRVKVEQQEHPAWKGKVAPTN